MRNLAYGLLITIGILIGFDYALQAEEVTTGNLLNNSTFGTGTTYSNSGWTITSEDYHNYTSLGGGNDPGGAVAADNANANLDYNSTSALALNSGTIQDAVGNNATLTLPSPGASGSLGANKALNVAGAVLPTISSSSLAADNSTIAVTMSEAVYNTNGGSGALEALSLIHI